MLWMKIPEKKLCFQRLILSFCHKNVYSVVILWLNYILEACNLLSDSTGSYRILSCALEDTLVFSALFLLLKSMGTFETGLKAMWIMIQSGDYREWWNVVNSIRNAFPRLRVLDTRSSVSITVGEVYGAFRK